MGWATVSFNYCDSLRLLSSEDAFSSPTKSITAPLPVTGVTFMKTLSLGSVFNFNDGLCHSDCNQFAAVTSTIVSPGGVLKIV